ncbi:uncharacterized protein LTR77_011176 [Saxophila tyrrhenica]|uniref:Alb1-domain-containing protein n=1 Tax=Saxophila tyrrhenica TaxID=1690608 RepID=A0AAV9NX89_9PEZI|nr:hypothetical protein LTR77_011176 [Saxophila tyrrhenica]
MKTPKVKKREVSVRSRAARRGNAPPPTEGPAVKSKEKATEYTPWLHNAQNSGISKKKKTKQLTRQQKQRQQKGLEHAERNIDKLEKKVADSKKRGKRLQARTKQWEELNELEPKVVEAEETGDAAISAKEQQKKGNRKEMDEVEMPDLEQPQPVQVPDQAVEQGDVPVADALPDQPSKVSSGDAALDAVDEIS